MSVDEILAIYASECGWTVATQLVVLKQFVEERGLGEVLNRYLYERAKEEESEGTSEGGRARGDEEESEGDDEDTPG